MADKADHWLSILMTKHPYMYDNVSTVDIRKTENAQYQEAEPEPEPEIASLEHVEYTVQLTDPNAAIVKLAILKSDPQQSSARRGAMQSMANQNVRVPREGLPFDTRVELPIFGRGNYRGTLNASILHPVRHRIAFDCCGRETLLLSSNKKSTDDGGWTVIKGCITLVSILTGERHAAGLRTHGGQEAF